MSEEMEKPTMLSLPSCNETTLLKSASPKLEGMLRKRYVANGREGDAEAEAIPWHRGRFLGFDPLLLASVADQYIL